MQSTRPSRSVGSSTAVKMSDKNQIAARAFQIEQLMSKRYFEDLGKHLSELEMIYMTKEHLQETDVVRAVYRVLKNCPSVSLKKKAKCLLAKWRAFYMNTHFKPRGSPKLIPVSANKEENVGLSQAASQDEIVGLCCSFSLLSSQDAANPTGAVGSENNTTQVELNKEHLGAGNPESTSKKSSELQDPTMSVRTKCVDLLYRALTSSATDLTKADLWQNFAKEIEEHVFSLYSNNIKKYKTCIRSKVANLKNPQNSHLQQNLLAGTMSAKEFAEMTVLDMASQTLKKLRASYTESSIREHYLPHVIDGTQTNKIKCKRCEKYNCKVTVIARGTLFLPSWVRNSNPDEQIPMSFVMSVESSGTIATGYAYNLQVNFPLMQLKAYALYV